MTKQKGYFYTIKKVRRISSKSDPDQHDEIFRSRVNPKMRKEQQELYDEGNDYGRPQQGGSFGDTYADLLRVSQTGGQNSSRRIGKNEAKNSEPSERKRTEKPEKNGRPIKLNYG